MNLSYLKYAVEVEKSRFYYKSSPELLYEPAPFKQDHP